MPEGAPQREAEIDSSSMEVRPSERRIYDEVVRAADRLFHAETDWLTFFREILGAGGIMRQKFKEPEDLLRFEHSPEFAHVQGLLAKLRMRGEPEPGTEPTKMITIRLPQSIHQSLIAEAESRATSMNKLCIAKLLQVIDEEMVPRPTPKKSNGEAPAKK